MKDVFKDRKKWYLFLDILIVVGALSFSLAAFSYVKKGKTINTIKTGAVTMAYAATSNTISIQNAKPMTDNEGKNLKDAGEYFDFTISVNKTTSDDVSYEVTAEKVEGTLNNNYATLYLEESYNNGSSYVEKMAPTVFNPMSVVDQFGAGTSEMVLVYGTESSSVTHYYRFRMWLNSSATSSNVTESFKVKIKAYGKYGAIN